MSLWSVLGQYLLLSFVLPGFCYLVVFYFCFPGVLGEVFPGVLGEIRGLAPLGGEAARSGTGKRDASQGFWISMVAIIGGLLLSSVAFAIEVLLRYFERFDCSWFPRVAFNELAQNEALPNFLAPEAFLHFNIGFGILIILLVFLFDLLYAKRGRTYPLNPVALGVTLFILVASNVIVSSHLYHRVADVVTDNKPDQAYKECTARPHLASFWLL